MNSRRIMLSTVAYTVTTFLLAIVWHIVLFEPLYKGFGYFQGEPDFSLGLLTIVIQGFVLSLLFPLVRLSGSALIRGLKFSLIVGVFFWTSHVLAFVAKQSVPDALSFVIIESVYLALQFGLFGILLGVIYRSKEITP
jgi:hypothetical protein